MLEAGQQFAHFKIIRMLGEGGMGQVYLAEDEKLGRQVALKILTVQYFDDAERLERFKREARTAAQVSHPNVMAIYDIGSAPESATGREINYIVMEYISGKTLSEYLKAKPNDIAAVVRLGEKIASGLAAAHKMQVVHRDIKADNIIVDDNDEPKILDFGLAKPISPVQMGSEGESTRTISRELTRAGKIIGTVSYMSPEQVRGEKVDARSDIFSFGVMLYRMASGEFPFSGPTEVSTLAKILETRQEPLSSRNTTIPQELERIVDKCLQKDANDRYQDTRDLVVDLRNLRKQYDSGITDSVSAMRTAPVKALKKRSLVLNWKTALLVIIVLAAFIKIFTGWLGGKSGTSGLQAKENSLAILGFDNKTGDSKLDWMESGLPEILLTDLAETRSINIISRQRILESLEGDVAPGAKPTTDQFLTAARDLGATTVLSGSYYKMGDKVRIDARLENIESGKVLFGEKVIGTDPFSLVDSLTNKVTASLNISQSATERGVAAVTSSSPEAYKQYVLGMERFGKLQLRQAVPFFEQAVAVDSTFALPYMRIGMADAFQQRSREASEAFAKAKHFEAKLPAKERALLDVYCNLWLDRKYDDAFTKLQVLVGSYPDDPELRAIYAVLVSEFAHDTTKAFAEFDTLMAQNPTYLFGLDYKAQIYLSYGQFDKVLELARKIKQAHPDAWSGYNRTATVLQRQGKYAEAVKEIESYLKRDPLSSEALSYLEDICVKMRDFGRARQIADSLRMASGGDPFMLKDYYSKMENLAEWSAQFHSTVQFSQQILDLMLATKDSLNIAIAYQDIADMYDFIGQQDSSLHYMRKAEKYSVSGMFPQLPLTAVEYDPKNDSWARPILDHWLADFKFHAPKNLWGIADALQELYNGYLRTDTAIMITALRDLVKVQGERSGSGNIKGLAQLLIAHGEYKEGKELLQGYISGTAVSANAASYVIGVYYLGLAEEGLGNRAEAIAHYREVLKYWGNPDVEVKQVTDTRKRLARLTS